MDWPARLDLGGLRAVKSIPSIKSSGVAPGCRKECDRLDLRKIDPDAAEGGGYGGEEAMAERALEDAAVRKPDAALQGGSAARLRRAAGGLGTAGRRSVPALVHQSQLFAIVHKSQIQIRIRGVGLFFNRRRRGLRGLRALRVIINRRGARLRGLRVRDNGRSRGGDRTRRGLLRVEGGGEEKGEDGFHGGNSSTKRNRGQDGRKDVFPKRVPRRRGPERRRPPCRRDGRESLADARGIC